MALGPPIVRNRGRRAIPILTAGVCAPATRAGESEGLRAVAFKHAEHPDRAHGQFEEEGANKKGEGRRVIFRKVTRGTGLFRCVCTWGIMTGSHGDLWSGSAALEPACHRDEARSDRRGAWLPSAAWSAAPHSSPSPCPDERFCERVKHAPDSLRDGLTNSADAEPGTGFESPHRGAVVRAALLYEHLVELAQKEQR